MYYACTDARFGGSSLSSCQPSHSAIVTMTTLVISTTACFNLTHLSSVLAILFESMWQQSALIEIMSAGTLSFCIAP